MDAFTGVIATVVAAMAIFAAFSLGQLTAQQDIKRKCEQFQVVDLQMTGSVFYCSRTKP